MWRCGMGCCVVRVCVLWGVLWGALGTVMGTRKQMGWGYALIMDHASHHAASHASSQA
jgi:hypothetical protein